MTQHTEPVFDLKKLKACIHCGFCLPVCPTYQATGSEAESPRGRLYLMKGLLDPNIPDDQRLTDRQVAPHMDQCLGCLACQTACPSGVEYGRLLAETREHLAMHRRHGGLVLKRWVFSALLPDRSRMKALALWLSIYQRSGLQWLVRQSRLLKFFPILHHWEALLPKIPNVKALHPGLSFGNPDGERVALFTGCLMGVFYTHVHWATIEALVANGYYVMIPEQTCCGALAHHAGERSIAEQLARKNVFSILKSNPDWVVVNAAGCGSTLKEYGALLADDPVYGQKAQVFSDIAVDVMALLAQMELKPFTTLLSQKVTYHAACHLHHAQGIRQEPIDVLKQIPGLALVPLKESTTCCGSAGIFNLEHPTLSEAILAEKIRHVMETHADRVVSGNPGCLLQIQKGLTDINHPMDVVHPVELVAAAYGKTTYSS